MTLTKSMGHLKENRATHICIRAGEAPLSLTGDPSALPPQDGEINHTRAG
jgi:hypothetical protein